jgi:hypothetical protein
MTLLIEHGVLTYCDVTAQSTPDQTVAVAGGTVLYQNAAAVVNGGSVNILGSNPADATFDRIDRVTADGSGNLVLVVGTPSSSPVAPDTQNVTLAQVRVWSSSSANYTGTIVSGVIQDTRVFVRLPMPTNSMAYTYLTSTSAADPGLCNLAFNNSSFNSATRLYLNYINATTGTFIQTWLGAGGGGFAGTGTIFPYYLRLYSRQNPANMTIWQVTAITDHGPRVWGELTVALQYSSSGTLTANPLSLDAYDTILEWDGIIASAPVSSGTFLKRTIYVTGTAQTHTFSGSATKALIRMTGGGGGGGGGRGASGQAGSAGGGGGGGYLEKLLTLVGSSATYTVGAKGTGGTGVTPTAGNNGTDSTLVHNAVTYTARAGVGGNAGTATGTAGTTTLGGAGGTTTNGDTNSFTGDAGDAGIVLSITSVLTGEGGDGLFGTGGAQANASGVGANATGHGAGGAGGAQTGIGSSNGGDGTDGLILIDEYS